MADVKVRNSQITWSTEGRPCGSTEASSLGWPPGDVPRSFDVVSDKTGRPELFTFKENVRQGGEVVGWKYVSGGGRSDIVVYND